jgi:hypothetical protein
VINPFGRLNTSKRIPRYDPIFIEELKLIDTFKTSNIRFEFPGLRLISARKRGRRAG